MPYYFTPNMYIIIINYENTSMPQFFSTNKSLLLFIHTDGIHII